MQRAINIPRETAHRVVFKAHSPKVVKLKPHALSQFSSSMFTTVTLMLLAGWIAASLVNDLLFLKETLVSSFIICCLLLLRGSEGKGHQVSLKRVYDLSPLNKTKV